MMTHVTSPGEISCTRVAEHRSCYEASIISGLFFATKSSLACAAGMRMLQLSWALVPAAGLSASQAGFAWIAFEQKKGARNLHQPRTTSQFNQGTPRHTAHQTSTAAGDRQRCSETKVV